MNRLFQGTVNLPGSKSESNRALMIAAYGGFPLEVAGLSDAHDTVSLKNLLEQSSLRGATATKQSTCCRISNFRRTCGLLRSARNDVVNCEDAGTVARFMLTYLAGKPGTWLLTGTERLCQRPMAPLIDALRQLGASIASLRGASATKQPTFAQIIGHPLKGGTVTLDASQSSQFASSLLLAAPTWEQGLQLTLKGNPVSMPYLGMTIKMMEYFGVQVVREGNTITVPHQTYQSRPFTVSADWSAASYWYEIMALSDGGELLLKGLKYNSLQGDAVVAKWFERFGVLTTFEPEGARLTKVPADPQILVFDFTDNPDLFPSVFSTCVALHYRARFQGVQNLSLKESNRVDSLISELSKLYTFINILENDGLVIEKSVLKVDSNNNNKVLINTFQDHRVAMALTPILLLNDKGAIDDPSVVNKSYPAFWEEVKRNCPFYKK